jgi:hypothetical protein
VVDPINIFNRPWRPQPLQNGLKALAAAPENDVASMGQGHPTGDEKNALAKGGAA